MHIRFFFCFALNKKCIVFQELLSYIHCSIEWDFNFHVIVSSVTQSRHTLYFIILNEMWIYYMQQNQKTTGLVPSYSSLKKVHQNHLKLNLYIIPQVLINSVINSHIMLCSHPKDTHTISKFKNDVSLAICIEILPMY